MLIDKEWEKRAKEYKEDLVCLEMPEDTENDFINGVQLYANSAERLLKDRQTELINDKPNATSSDEQAQYDLLIVELALILNKLKSIKPL